MAGRFTDQQIAATLNRLGLRTGVGNSWNAMRVRSARSYYKLPAFAPDDRPREVTLQEAASRLNVSQSTVRRMIEEKILPARQVVLCAPWKIPIGALESEAIRQEAANIQNRLRAGREESGGARSRQGRLKTPQDASRSDAGRILPDPSPAPGTVPNSGLDRRVSRVAGKRNHAAEVVGSQLR